MKNVQKIREKYRREKREAFIKVYFCDSILIDLEDVQEGPRSLSTEEAGDYWGVTRKTVARWCSEGRVEGAFRSSDHPKAPWRIPEEAVQGPPPPAPKDEDEKSGLELLRERRGR